jgi:hypothetical protein
MMSYDHRSPPQTLLNGRYRRIPPRQRASVMVGELKCMMQRFMIEMDRPAEFARYVHAHLKASGGILFNKVESWR